MENRGAGVGTDGNMPKDNQKKSSIDGNESKNNDLVVAKSKIKPQKQEKGSTNENGEEGAVGQPVVSVPVSMGGIGEVVPGQFSDASSSDGDIANTAAAGNSSGAVKDEDSAQSATDDKLRKAVGGTAASISDDQKEKTLRKPTKEQKPLEKTADDVSTMDAAKKETTGVETVGDEKKSVAVSSRETQPSRGPTLDAKQLHGSVSGAAKGIVNQPPLSATPPIAPSLSVPPPASASESKGLEKTQTQQLVPNKNTFPPAAEKHVASVSNTAVPLQRALPPNVRNTNNAAAAASTITTSPAQLNSPHSMTKAAMGTAKQTSKPQTAPNNPPLQKTHVPDTNRKRALPLPHGATTAAAAAAAAVAAANAAAASTSLPTSAPASVIPKTQVTTQKAPIQTPSSHRKAVVNTQNVTVQRAGAFNNPPPTSLVNATKTVAVTAPTTVKPTLQTHASKMSKTVAPIPASSTTTATTVPAYVSAPLSIKAKPTSLPRAATSKPITPATAPGRGGATPTTTAAAATKPQNIKTAKSASSAPSRPQAASNKIASSSTAAAATDKNESISSMNVAAAGGAVSMPQIKAGHPPQIADPTVIKAVHDILGLLQTYGPLTHDQLEYNLPPLNQTPSPSPVGGGVSPTAPRGSSSNGSSKLQQILDILVVTGIVNIIADDSLQTEDPSAAPDAVQSNDLGQNAQIPSQPPRYAFLQGVPRADTIMPSQLLSQLRDAHKEVEQTKERIEILRNELRVISDDDNETSSDERIKNEETMSETEEEVKGAENISGGAADDVGAKNKKRKKEKKTGSRTAREVLKSLLLSYPEIIYDPVYAAALRSLNIDIGAVDRERERGCTTSSKKRKSSSSPAKAPAQGSVITSSSSKKKKSIGKGSTGDASGTTKTTGTSSPKATPVTSTSSTKKEPETENNAAGPKNIVDKSTSAASASMASSS